jgi:Tol biopolymer transport system component
VGLEEVFMRKHHYCFLVTIIHWLYPSFLSLKIRAYLLFFALFLVTGTPILLLAAATSPEEPLFRDVDLIREISEGRMASYYREDTTTAVSVSPFASLNVKNPPFPSRIAFQALRNNNWDIYLMDPKDPDYEARLTSAPSAESFPSLNHGATRLAFVTDRDGNNEIYRVDVSGGNLFNISQHPHQDFNPAWSRDNSRLAFNSFRTGNSEIFAVNSDGSNLVKLTNHPAYDGQPSWSPDGTQIVFSSRRTGRYELWLMNADGSNQRQLTFGANALYPAWSPRGDQIAFANDGDGDGWLELWLINVDGSGARRHLPGSPLQDYWLPAWSPDGNAISFTLTYWFHTQGNFYWYSSYIMVANPLEPNSYTSTYIRDTTAWRSSWASMDASGPNPCVIRVGPEQNQNTFIVSWMATDVGEAGVRSYNVQMRQGTTGPWQTLLANASDVAARMQAADGPLQFRCRAQDRAYNWGSWGQPVTTVVDTAWPDSRVRTLPRQTPEGPITVQWAGNAPGLRYNVFVRDGTDGNWEIWQNNVTNTSATFTGTAGHTYYFRSQARDGRQLEPWQAKPDTAVAFYAYTISGLAKDNRGYPVAEPVIDLVPAAVDVAQNPHTGEYTLFVATAGDYTVGFSADGHNPTPQTAVSVTDNKTFNVFLPPADDGVVNGGFEFGNLDGWTVTGSEATIAATARHTGDYGLLIHHPAVAETTLVQSLTIDAAWVQPTLSFLYHLPTNLNDGTFRVQLANGTGTTTLLDTAVATPAWQHIWADLGAYTGQTITLTLTANHAGGTIWLDEISLGSWQTPQITAVSPTRWSYQQPATLVITGTNFINTPSLFLNEIALDNVVWVNGSRLQVNIPATLPEGNYRLTVVNPNGNKAIASQTFTVTQERLFLPLILKPGMANPITADWPTRGYDVGHTGYNRVDPGAARYSLLWSKNLPFSGGVALQNIAVSNSIVVATSEVPNGTSAVVALDLATGAEKWRKEIVGRSVSPPTIAHGAVYVVQNTEAFTPYATYVSYLHAIDLISGQDLWRVPLRMPYVGNFHYYQPVVAEDKIFLGGESLISLDAFKGKESWLVSWNGVERWMPGYHNDFLYHWSSTYFVARRATDGEGLWLVDTDGQTGTASLITGNRAVLSGNTKLININLTTQAIAWSVSGNYAQNMVAAADGVLYSMNGQRLEARALTNGNLLWYYDTDATLVNAPVIAGNYVYVVSEEKTFVINRTTRQLAWTADKGGWLAVANGYLFVADRNKIIYAYRAEEP